MWNRLLSTGPTKLFTLWTLLVSLPDSVDREAPCSSAPWPLVGAPLQVNEERRGKKWKKEKKNEGGRRGKKLRSAPLLSSPLLSSPLLTSPPSLYLCSLRARLSLEMESRLLRSTLRIPVTFAIHFPVIVARQISVIYAIQRLFFLFFVFVIQNSLTNVRHLPFKSTCVSDLSNLFCHWL